MVDPGGVDLFPGHIALVDDPVDILIGVRIVVLLDDASFFLDIFDTQKYHLLLKIWTKLSISRIFLIPVPVLEGESPFY
jgi:hypothetical protein